MRCRTRFAPDALGPATRRNGCVGNASPYVSAVFAKCLGSSCAFRKTGVCRARAVRFAKILRVYAVRRVAVSGLGDDAGDEAGGGDPEGDPEEKRGSGPRPSSKRSSETPNVPRNPKPGVVRRVTPLATRADAPGVARRRRRRARRRRRRRRRRRNTGGGAGGGVSTRRHASAAEALTKARAGDAFALRARWRRRTRTRVTTARRGGSPARARGRASRVRRGGGVCVFPPRGSRRVDKTDDDAMRATSARASALGDGNEAILVANDLDSVSSAFSWLENALVAERSRFSTRSWGSTASGASHSGARDDQPGDRRAQPAAAGTALNEFFVHRNSTKESNEKTECTARISARVDRARLRRGVRPRRRRRAKLPAPARDSCVESSPSACFAGSASHPTREGSSRATPSVSFRPHSIQPFAAATVCARDVAATLGGEKKNEHARVSLSGLARACVRPGKFFR